jgi:hypothetical protein
MEPRARLLLCFFGIGLVGCPEDEVPEPPVVAPEYGDPCRYETCSDQGMCRAENGAPVCHCDVGYGGDDCSVCEAGFHGDFRGRCVPDVACAGQPENPCGSHGSCEDASGVIACACDPGYEGPRCTLCASSYGRSEDGECLLLVLGEPGGTVQIPRPDPDDPKPEPSEECEEGSCSGRGSCDDSSGEVECDCDEGYEGNHCESCDDSHLREGADCVPIALCTTSTCGSNGTCSDDPGTAVCTCDEGYEGAACEGCASGFHDEAGTCVVNEECAPSQCGTHGSCDDSSGIASCSCNTGYGGASCEACASGYHPGPSGSCVANQACSTNSCPENSACDASGGSAVCHCDPGYAGPECKACASGYYRDHIADECVQFVCSQNPIKASATIPFDGLTGFPTPSDNCVSPVAFTIDDVTFESIAGDGQVWACSPSTFYGLTTAHLLLEAGSLGPAALLFRGPVDSVSFDYGAKSAIALELIADGVVVQTLSAPRWSHGTLSLAFAAPITKLELRSTSGATNRLAIDNLVYAPPPCN